MRRERGSTIHRVLDILETIARARKPLSATEINDALSLPKATAHRLCAELEASGYLLKKINGKSYLPGNRLHDMAVGVLSHSRFRTQRRAILENLAGKVGETCNIAYADGLSMAYSDRVLSRSPLRLNLPLGTRVPLHCTASGKLFLASLSLRKRKAVIEKLELDKVAPGTITDREVLLAEIAAVEENGYAIDNEEIFEGMIAVAVPITDVEGRFYSSLAIQAPVFRFTLDDARAHLQILRDAAVDLSTLTAE